MEMLIDGKKTASSTGEVIRVMNPATGALIDTVPAASREDIDRAFEAAEQGKKLWAKTPLHERCGKILKFTELFRAHKEELAHLLSAEVGKSLKDARTELARIDIMAEGYAERAKHLYTEVLSEAQPGMEHDITLTKRVPLGTVVCIVPFNHPVSLYMQKVAPALAMGNAVIVKPPTDCPLTLIRVTELFLEAGVPGSVIQIVTGRGSVIGDYIVEHKCADAVALTGSTQAGVHIAKLCAEKLAHVHLELGGNDAVVVFDDADLDAAVADIVISRAPNAGQTCASTKRIVVQNTVREALTEKLIERLRKIKVGDPSDESTDVGCLISEHAAKEVEEQVALTLSQGAKCLLGGKRNGAFFDMTVLGDVTAEMDIARDMEVFGPVFPVIGFDTEEEAVGIVNGSCYGLTAGVMSGDIYRAIRVAEQLDAGGVVVNGVGNYRPPELAFGGFKMSGIGREGVSATLEEMSQLKSYTMRNIR